MAKAKKVAASVPVDGPWAIPDGWRWEALGGLGKWTGGGTPSKARADFWNGGTIPWVSPKDMKRPLLDSSEDMITADAVVGSSAKMVNRGSVLCVMRSGILRHTFPVAVNLIDVTLNQDMRALTPRADVNPRYLAYYLELSGQTVLDTASKGGTTVNSIEVTRFDRHPVPIPGLDSQRLIVARIDELLAEIGDGEAALRRARDDLGTWRKALLKAAVTGELTSDWRAANPPTETGADLLARILVERRKRWDTVTRTDRKGYAAPAGPNVGKLPEIPASWAWSNIDQLATRVTKGSSPGWQGFEYQPQGILFVRSQNVGWGRLLLGERVYVDKRFNEVESKAVLKPGDVLLNIVGASIGRACKASVVVDGANTNQAVAGIRPVSEALSDWLVAWLVSPAGQAAVFKNVVETARANLSLEQVRAIPVPLPPPGEIQTALAAYHDAIDAHALAVDDVTSQLGLSKTLRQSVLAAAFRGELA